MYWNYKSTSKQSAVQQPNSRVCPGRPKMSNFAAELPGTWPTIGGQVDLELSTVTFSGLAKPHCLICSSPYHSHTDCPSADPSRQHIRNRQVCFWFNHAYGCSSTSWQFPPVCRCCHSSNYSVISCPPGLEISTRKLTKCEWFFKVASLKNIL